MNPSGRQVDNGTFKRIDGEWHKLCTGPAHEEPVYLPATDKFFHRRKSGRREGKLVSRCHLCINWSKLASPGSNHGWIKVAKVRHFYVEADRRVGLAELAKRTGISRNALANVLNGKITYVQKATFRRVMLELISMRRRNEHSAPPGVAWRIARRHDIPRRKLKPAAEIHLHEQEPYLATLYPVDNAGPDPRWWIQTGMSWVPRYGEEVLGSDF